MALVEHDFTTEQEANGFVRGIEYANDSSLSVSEMPHQKEGRELWAVIVEDDDL